MGPGKKGSTLRLAVHARGIRFGCLAATFFFLLLASSAAGAVPPGFVDDVFIAGLEGPTDVEFAPDGRIFVAEQRGRIRIVENGVLQAQPFVDIGDRVNNIFDRGLLGIAIHPDFPATPWVYALYTYDPPEAASASGNGARDQPGQRSSRLERFVADPQTGWSTATSSVGTVLAGTNSNWQNNGEPDGFVNDVNAPWACTTGGTPFATPIQDCIPSDSTTHSIGTVTFGPDGMLYFGSGDGASPGQVDDRAMRTFDPDSMTGKIFRIDPVTGQGLPDNPWFDGDPSHNRSKFISRGLRNPYRFVIHPQTAEPFIGDVGWATWEEINQGWGVNFGWPCYEGGSGTNIRQPGYEALPECQSYYQDEQAGIEATRAPIWAYDRTGASGAAMASSFYTGTAFPTDMHGALLIADYTQNWIRYIPFSSGQPLLNPDGTAQVRDFTNSAITPVDVEMGPDENLYYISYFQNQIRRIAIAGALDVEYQYFEGDWNVLPDFSALPPVSTGSTANFDLSPRQQNDFFGFRFDTCVTVPNSGTWRFYTRSDDGSKLWVNGSLVVDNDGLHATVEESGFVTLSAGIHTVRVDFFDKTQAEFLEVGWEGPGVSSQAIPTGAITSCSGENRAPILTDPGAQTTSINQNVSLFVQATDPDGDALTWSANGLPPGLAIDSSTGEIFGSPTVAGTSVAEVTVSDGLLSDSVDIPWSVVTNRAPTATITLPSGATFAIGETVDYAGFGNDPDEGSLPGSALTWVATLHHLDHTHPAFTDSGFSGSFTYSDHDDEIFFELCLTATDSEGASGIDCVNIFPTKVNYQFSSSPSGVSLSYNGVARPAPFSVQIPVGAQRNLSAPQTHNGQNFTSWSNGGPRSQVLAIGTSDQTLLATYGGGSGDPTHLLVTTSGGYRHLKLGHSSASVWSPKIDPTAGGQTHLEIELRDFAGNADWQKLVIAPQGVGSKGVRLGDFISGQPTGWFTIQIPLSAFASDAFDGGISHLSVPFSENAASFEIGFRKLEFTGGAASFLWFGDPGKTDNAFQGSGAGGELLGEIVAGGGGSNTAAVVVQPTGGSVINSSSVAFSWNDTGANSYRLRVGPAPGVWSFHDQNHGTATGATVHGIPLDGQTVHVRLESVFSTETLFFDTSYATTNTNPHQAASLTSPPPGSTLGSTSATFSWNDTGAISYRLRLGPQVGQWSYHDQSVGTATSVIVTGLPDDGSTIHARLESSFTNPTETLAHNVTYIAHSTSTGDPTTYLRITNPGGYRHLKLGFGTSHIWAPQLSPATGNDQLRLTLRDAGGDLDWSRLDVAPGGDTTKAVTLGDYVSGQPAGWFEVVIPLGDFPAGAWDQVTHMSVPFSRDAAAYELHVGRIEFAGTNDFVWFGAPEKTDNAFEGNGGGGQLQAELIEP